jgi:glycerol-3-phosphate dehydrogenase
MGGKWTTYRKMGEELVDKICEKEKEKGKDYGVSQTRGLPLIGSTSENLKEKLFK